MSRTDVQLPATARLRLRPLGPDDTAAQVAGEDDEIVRRLSGQRNTEAGHRDWLVGARQRWESGTDVFDLGIEVVDGAPGFAPAEFGVLTGMVGLQWGMDYLEPGQLNLTYAVYAPFRGRGVATGGVSMAMEMAPSLWPVREFVIRADPDNAASTAVARRSGFALSHTTQDEHGHLQWFTRPAGGTGISSG